MALFCGPREEAELHINAYLEVIRRPSPQVISQIKTALRAESFQQVGLFVWTYLNKLMESLDLANKYIQQLLNDEILAKEFDLEKLKFSRNYEASAFFERFNAGGKRNNPMALFCGPREEAELHINAYLEVIRRPSPQVISQIKTALRAESFQQVGLFVWTYLNKLMESLDLANKYIQQLLNDEILAKEFDLEKLKFSRNYEASAFFERFNAGGKDKMLEEKCMDEQTQKRADAPKTKKGP